MQPPSRLRPVVLCLVVSLLAAGCGAAPGADSRPVAAGGPGDADPAPPADPPPPAPAPAPATAPAPAPAPIVPAADPQPPAPEVLPARPAWLGTRVLPLRPDGFGEIQPTPPELDDRRLPPPDTGLATPATAEFTATVGPVPDEVAARSTWSPGCPVGRDDLRYLTVTFWGFDERAHTGELLVHARVADAMVGVFRQLYDSRFPIEEMRVVDRTELDAPPTGDGNNTTAFVCRPTVSSGAWSQHAYGLAVDINPFHNPYARRDVVLPELASTYVDRSRHRPGMVQPGDAVTAAFAAIGWPWGGDWRSAKDWMHFSHNGR